MEALFERINTLSIWVFMDVLLCSHDWLSHWPLAISSTSSPFLSSWKSGSGIESFNFLITWQPAPLLGGVQNSPSLTQTEDKSSHCYYCPGNSKDFECCDPETVDEDKIYLRKQFQSSEWPNTFLINHNIAPKQSETQRKGRMRSLQLPRESLQYLIFVGVKNHNIGLMIPWKNIYSSKYICGWKSQEKN